MSLAGTSAAVFPIPQHRFLTTMSHFVQTYMLCNCANAYGMHSCCVVQCVWNGTVYEWRVLFPSWHFLTTHCLCNWITYHLSTSSLKINQSIDHFCPNVTYKDWLSATNQLLTPCFAHYTFVIFHVLCSHCLLHWQRVTTELVHIAVYIYIDDGMRLMLLLGCQCHLFSSQLGVLSVWMCMSSRICHCNNTRNNI